MTDEIKKRIELIKSGKTPKGYSKDAVFIPLEWEFKELKKIARCIKEKAGNKELETLSISAGIGFVNQASKFGKELSGAQYVNYTVLNKGDFSYNKGNSKKYPQGCVYMLKDRDVAAVPNVFNSFRLNQEICNSSYYANLFTNGYLNKQLYKFINSGVRNDGLLNLYDDDFYSCLLPVPPIAEQKKIAEILNCCDKVIELKKQMLVEECKQKKWLLQNLLNPNSGVRLGNFYEEWNNVSISSLCNEIVDGDWIESKDQSDFGFRLIQTGNVGVGKLLNKNERAKYIDDDTFKRLKCTEVLKGDILISRLPDPIGRACIIEELEQRSITAVDCSILRFKNQNTARYVLQYMCSSVYFKKIAALSGGSTRTRVSRKEIETLEISIPSCIEEQIAITNILTTSDRKIEVLELELEQWQLKKKSLMQLLLTGIVRVQL